MWMYDRMGSSILQIRPEQQEPLILLCEFTFSSEKPSFSGRHFILIDRNDEVKSTAPRRRDSYSYKSSLCNLEQISGLQLPYYEMGIIKSYMMMITM